MTSKPHILIIEDDRLLNKLLVSEIKRMGYAADGVFNDQNVWFRGHC